MSDVINHDTNHLRILSMHANLHETNFVIFRITIAVIVINNFDCHAEAVFFPSMFLIQSNSTILRKT